jgi:glycogen operon protein
MSKPPLLQTLAFDPILGNVKLIAEAWDAGGLYQVGSFPAWNRWAEWNGKYRDDLRDYLKGNLSLADTAARRITGSLDLYDPKLRGSNASVNFLNCHDGFTLWDMYTYNQKHNEANGWNNTDGSNDNHSWNCGTEGETDNEEILSLRRRLAKNAFTVLMMSRGMPMFPAGDEFLNSQFGNNNAYCQDNEISWLNWEDLIKNQEHFNYVKHVIHLRQTHAIVRRQTERCSIGFPEIQILMPDERSKILRIVYAGRNRETQSDDIVCLALNIYWEAQICELPELSSHLIWKLEADTSMDYLPQGIPDPKVPYELRGNRICMAPRSSMILIAGDR